MIAKPDTFEKVLFVIFLVANLLTLYLAWMIFKTASFAQHEWPVFIGLIELLIFQVLILNTFVVYALLKVMKNE